MSYMRSPYHIYPSSDSDGKETITFIDPTDDSLFTLPRTIFDELCVMHMAKMSIQEIREAQERAVRLHAGNISCEPLTHRIREEL